VNRATYDFKGAKSDLVAALNEVSKALTDLGLAAALHSTPEPVWIRATKCTRCSTPLTLAS